MLKDGDNVLYYGGVKKWHGMLGVVESADPLFGRDGYYNVKLENGRMRRGCIKSDLVPVEPEILWEV